MRIRAYIAIAALVAPLFLAAGALEASAQDAPAVAPPETETSAALDCPEHDASAGELSSQEELVRNIRTIVTGEKSSAQKEALAQAARIAPGQMSDALREVLVDAAAFVNHFYSIPKGEIPDARLDSLSRLAACSLQPHFSQEKLTEDILSINPFNDQGRHANQAQQEIASWLAMHIRPEEMGEELKNAIIDGMLSIGGEFCGMYLTWHFLSEALLKQYAGHSDADLASKIRTAWAEEDIDALRLAIHAAVQWSTPSGIINAPENIGAESRSALIEILSQLNEILNERRTIIGDEEAEQDYHWGNKLYRIHSILEEIMHDISAEEAKYGREDVQRRKKRKADLETPNKHGQSELESVSLSQDEIFAAIQAITRDETGERQLKAVQYVEKMAEADPAQIESALRIAVVDALYHMSSQPEYPAWDAPNAYTWHTVRRTLESAILAFGDAETIKLFAEREAYDLDSAIYVGTVSKHIFNKFPDQSIPLINEYLSKSDKQPEKTSAAFEILVDMVVYYKRGILDISQENRNLLIATTRRFLEKNDFRSGIQLAIALDDPDLIDILQDMATHPEKLIMRGIPAEQVGGTQNFIQKKLDSRPYMGGYD